MLPFPCLRFLSCSGYVFSTERPALLQPLPSPPLPANHRHAAATGPVPKRHRVVAAPLFLAVWTAPACVQARPWPARVLAPGFGRTARPESVLRSLPEPSAAPGRNSLPVGRAHFRLFVELE